MNRDENYHDDKYEPEDWEILDEADKTSALAKAKRRSILKQLWQPQKLPKPSIDPDLKTLEWPERIAEVLRYTLLNLEFWLSRKGVLREWIRLNLYVAVVLSAAALMIIPPLTAVLEGAEGFTGLLGGIVENIMVAALKLPPLVIGVATLLILARFLFRKWIGLGWLAGRPQSRSWREDQYDER